MHIPLKLIASFGNSKSSARITNQHSPPLRFALSLSFYISRAETSSSHYLNRVLEVHLFKSGVNSFSLHQRTLKTMASATGIPENLNGASEQEPLLGSRGDASQIEGESLWVNLWLGMYSYRTFS